MVSKENLANSPWPEKHPNLSRPFRFFGKDSDRRRKEKRKQFIPLPL